MILELPIIIDVEASGFGRGSYPIEIGFSTPDRIVHTFLIQPESDWTHWDESAAKLHNISRQQLMERGESVVDVAKSLNSLLSGQVIYSDAWGFDSSWIGKLFNAANIYQRFKVEALNTLLSQEEMDAWQQMRITVANSLGLIPHRAGNDAQLLQEVFLRIKEQSKTTRSKATDS